MSLWQSHAVKSYLENNILIVQGGPITNLTINPENTYISKNKRIKIIKSENIVLIFGKV